MDKTLYLVRGLSGSGKSFKAGILSECVISTDDFFYDTEGVYKFDPTMLVVNHKRTVRLCTKLMQGSEPNIAVANTFSRKWEMEEYLWNANKYGYEVKIVTPDTPWAWDVVECHKRNVHGVPLEIIQKMKDRWEEV